MQRLITVKTPRIVLEHIVLCQRLVGRHCTLPECSTPWSFVIIERLYRFMFSSSSTWNNSPVTVHTCWHLLNEGGALSALQSVLLSLVSGNVMPILRIVRKKVFLYFFYQLTHVFFQTNAMVCLIFIQIPLYRNIRFFVVKMSFKVHLLLTRSI